MKRRQLDGSRPRRAGLEESSAPRILVSYPEGSPQIIPLVNSVIRDFAPAAEVRTFGDLWFATSGSAHRGGLDLSNVDFVLWITASVAHNARGVSRNDLRQLEGIFKQVRGRILVLDGSLSEESTRDGVATPTQLLDLTTQHFLAVAHGSKIPVRRYRYTEDLVGILKAELAFLNSKSGLIQRRMPIWIRVKTGTMRALDLVGEAWTRPWTTRFLRALHQRWRILNARPLAVTPVSAVLVGLLITAIAWLPSTLVLSPAREQPTSPHAAAPSIQVVCPAAEPCQAVSLAITANYWRTFMFEIRDVQDAMRYANALSQLEQRSPCYSIPLRYALWTGPVLIHPTCTGYHFPDASSQRRVENDDMPGPVHDFNWNESSPGLQPLPQVDRGIRTRGFTLVRALTQSEKLVLNTQGAE